MSNPPTDLVDLRSHVTFTGFHIPQPQPQPDRTTIASDVPQTHVPERTTVASVEPRVHMPQRTAVVSDEPGIHLPQRAAIVSDRPGTGKLLLLRCCALGKKCRSTHKGDIWVHDTAWDEGPDVDVTLSDDIGESDDGIALVFSLGSGTLQTFDPSLASEEASPGLGGGDEETSVVGDALKKDDLGATKVVDQTKELIDGDKKQHDGVRGR